MKKNSIYLLSIEDYLKIIELAKKNGKKAGDSMKDEFMEYLKTVKNIEKIGEIEMDIDLLAGNLREEGLKILNLKELERKNKENSN